MLLTVIKSRNTQKVKKKDKLLLEALLKLKQLIVYIDLMGWETLPNYL